MQNQGLDGGMAPSTSPYNAPQKDLPPFTIPSPKQVMQSAQPPSSSSSSPQPYPVYPIKIPPEKQKKALELYKTFKQQELLAKNDKATLDDGYPSTAATTGGASPAPDAEPANLRGKKVRPRKRKRLSPKLRARAALVRYLGSCQPCRSRRVPVSDSSSSMTLSLV